MIIGLEEEELAPASPHDSWVVLHIPLREYFPDTEELQHEHILLTTAPSSEADRELNDILEDDLGLDQNIDNIRVFELTSDTLHRLRSNPTEMFDIHLDSPFLVINIVLGGQKGVEGWSHEYLERVDES